MQIRMELATKRSIQGSCGLTEPFPENLNPGDTSCANTPETVWRAVGRFPLTVKEARPAKVDPSGSNQVGISERKTASVVVATAIDALQRSWSFFASDGVGPRGGTFHTDFFGPITLTSTTLTDCAQVMQSSTAQSSGVTTTRSLPTWSSPVAGRLAATCMLRAFLKARATLEISVSPAF